MFHQDNFLDIFIIGPGIFEQTFQPCQSGQSGCGSADETLCIENDIHLDPRA